jgi:hypothetical protein
VGGGFWDPQSDPYLHSLLLRARRTLAGQSIAKAAVNVRAIVGVPTIPVGEVDAQAAWNKLRSGQRPTGAELASLETVIRLMRPAPLSRAGELEPLASVEGASAYNSETVAAWNGFRARVKPFLYSIGRLERAVGPDASVGTGFLVGPDLVLTNRHVVSDLTMGTEVLDPGQAVITFNEEADTVEPDASRIAVTGIVALHPLLDLALLRVALPNPRPVPAFASEPASLATEIAAVGYPFKDGRNPIFVDAIYGSSYGVKRAALGQVTGGSGARMFHDCSTLGGSSGSPLFSLASGRVVGVHYTGQFMYRNEAVPAADVAVFLAQVPR